MLCVIMLSSVMLSAIMLSVVILKVMLNVAILTLYAGLKAESHYAEYRHAECNYA